MKYKVFGCKVNKYYTDEWLNSEYLSDKTGVFIASCVVTDNAKKKWIKFVKQELKNIKDNEKIYISGCGAFDGGEENKDFFNIYEDLKDYKDKIVLLGESPNENKKDWNKKNKLTIKKDISNLKSIYTKKFIIIQGGCDSFCTFCLTVIKRGKHFYRSMEDIVDEITDFESRGGKEVVLTGVNLGAWGKETTNDFEKPELHKLLNYILEKTEIPRIRISSLGVEFIDDNLIEVFKKTRIYPHFHLSIQSGSDNILKLMRRHYDKKFLEETLKKINSIKREDGVDISIGADLIVGFPGETEEDFLQTYNLVKNYKITKIHAFPFSRHSLGENVPASYFPNQVDEKTKKDRLDRLIFIGDKVREDFIKSQKGKILHCLVESVKGNNFKGWSENYIEINETNFEIISGNIRKNEIITGKLK